MTDECQITDCPIREGVGRLKAAIDKNTEKLEENARSNNAVLAAFANAVPLKLVIVIIVVIFMAKSANEIVEHYFHGVAKAEETK
jgi:hypothetical protein